MRLPDDPGNKLRILQSCYGAVKPGGIDAHLPFSTMSDAVIGSFACGPELSEQQQFPLPAEKHNISLSLDLLFVKLCYEK